MHKLFVKPPQEVDEYDTFYKGNLERCGYSSLYIQRSGQKRDGCGIFFKHEKYAVFFFLALSERKIASQRRQCHSYPYL